jgi:hypothetical protein
MKYGYVNGNGLTAPANNASSQQQPSLLSQEEQEALKPKEVKVENPWIYEQTHQEYLENIKVSQLVLAPLALDLLFKM